MMATHEKKVESRIEWGKNEIAGPRHDFREGLMLGALKCLRQGRVLDAGCGSGSLSIKLARRGLAVEAVDLSANFVSMVERKARALGLGEAIKASQMDVTSLDFPNESFDVVTGGELLEHVPDDGRAVAEFARVLKPDGVGVVTVPANPNLWTPCDEWAGHQRRYTKRGLGELFSPHGFHVVSIRHWGFPTIRCYDRFVFQPYARRMMCRTSEERRQHALTRAGTNPVVTRIVGLLFSVDLLFSFCDWGPGLILIARKTRD